MEDDERPFPEPAGDEADPGARPEPTVVGIGASAGGLDALKRFFQNVPEDSGLAFVVVVHLSPEHKSHLAELLQPHVGIPVEQVTQTLPLEPNHVYVIPPNANLNTIDTHLRLSELEENRRHRAPIDHFFRTLAATHDGNAVSIVLTGTGSDGTLGIREINERGGLTIVQDPAQAEYDGMPRSAIATGVVDLILPLERIPEAVTRYARTKPRISVPPDGEAVEEEERLLLEKIFAQLRARTNRNFSRYKRSTIMRRIQRRMQLRYVEDLKEYLVLLREEPDEVRALADDFLITVTNFFRDAEVFENLQKNVIPALFEDRGPDDSIRVWTVGCATGEEAYSLAMLFLEEVERRKAPSPRLQIFASDLHAGSLEKAREGFYPGDIETDVSEERLRRFFEKENGGYRIRKHLRERVVFAPHNLLADPPFSNLDLISCRNVMIYLQQDVQRDVTELFHYALKPDGYLLLGSSESLAVSDLFITEEKKLCLYRRRNVPAPDVRLPVFPGAAQRLGRRGKRGQREDEPLHYGRLHERMVEQLAPPSVLVGPDHSIVHFSEHAGRYLIHPGGEPTSSVFKLVREELRIELRSALHAATDRGESSRSKPIHVRFNGEVRPVVVHVRPALEPEQEGYMLVLFDEYEPDEMPGPPASESADATVRELQAELDQTKERLQSIIEEYESSQAEMKASNEELQSANEELRSTMEELETSREELHSMNEELQTVNQENRHKVEELAQLSGDLQNLMASTEIATIFLDRELRILRFTPRASELFNVRVTDRGRPLADITHRLGYLDLTSDARQVLKKLVPVEREVQDEDGRWFLARVLPYRSADDRIEGIVITFVEITDRKRVENELRNAKEYSESIVETLHEPLLVLDPDLRVQSANPAFYDWFQVSSSQTLGRRVYDLGNGEWDIPELRELLEEVLPENNVFNDYEVANDFEDIGERVVLVNGRRLDHVQLILLGIRDITERKVREQALRDSEERFRAVAELVPDLLWRSDPDGEMTWYNRRWMEYTGQAIGEALGRGWLDVLHPDDRHRSREGYERSVAEERPLEQEYRIRRHDGAYRWFLARAEPVRDAEGRVQHWFGTATDVHEQRTARETLEQRVEERTKQVRDLARGLTMAEQQERRRISQVLHDDLQQLLYGIEMKISTVSKRLGDVDEEFVGEQLGQISDWLDHAVSTTRQLTVELSPPILQEEGLADALQWLQSQMQELHGLNVSIETNHGSYIEDEDLRVLLFQIVRELLFNVIKHAEVDSAMVRLEDVDGCLVIQVFDEGKGFDVDAATSAQNDSPSFGLYSVRERLALLGGSVEVHSRPGEGTHVEVRTPIEPRPRT